MNPWGVPKNSSKITRNAWDVLRKCYGFNSRNHSSFTNNHSSWSCSSKIHQSNTQINLLKWKMSELLFSYSTSKTLPFKSRIETIYLQKIIVFAVISINLYSVLFRSLKIMESLVTTGNVNLMNYHRDIFQTMIYFNFFITKSEFAQRFKFNNYDE